jgi:hypothetical protein
MRTGPLALAGLAALAWAPVTASAEWSVPVRVSAADRASYGSPAAAVGPAGRALAAWIRTPAGSPRGAGRAQLAERAAGRGWAGPRWLSGPGASMPRLAVNGRGDAAAAWLSGRLILAAVRRGPAGAWRAARVGEAGAPVQDLLVSLDQRGSPVAAWVERRGGGFGVRLATGVVPAGAPWTVRPARLTTPGPEPPALALSPGKGALAAWVSDDRVLAARTVAGAFERPVELSEPDAGPPGIALGGSGSAIVSWSVRLPGGTPVLLAAGRPATAPRWSAAEDLGIGRAPVAAVNEVGDAVVAWGIGESGREQAVEASTRRRGGLWRASTIVPPRDCGCLLGAESAAMDGTGAAVVSWRREGGEEGAAAGAAALVPGGEAWERAPVPSTGEAGAPAVAAAPTAGAAAVWSTEGSRGGVRAVLHSP